MAAVRHICFSPLLNSPLVYPSLCARHRRLWTVISNRATVYFSSSARNNCQKVLNSFEEATNSSRIENTPAQSQRAHVWNEESTVEESPADSVAPGCTLEHGDAHPTQVKSAHQDKNGVTSRLNNSKNQRVRYQRQLPQTGDSSILFTIGKRRLSLENAQSALAQHNIMDTDPADGRSEVGGASIPLGLINPSFQTKRSRTNDPSVTTSDLLKHIRKRHDLSQKDMELYSASLPSLLGVTVDTISNTAAELGEAGFSVEEVHNLLALFPHIFDVNYDNVYEVYSLFTEYLQHTRWIHGLIHRYPFLLTLDPSQVRDTLETFHELGLNAREMSSIFSHFPLVFFTPLSEETLTRSKEALQAGLSSQWLSKAFLHAMRYRPARAELRNSAALVTEILREYQVDVGEVLVKYPDLFRHTPDQLMTVIEVLSGKPLYLRMDDIKMILSLIPEVVCQLEDMVALKAHLNLLSEIFTPSILRNVIHSVKSLLDYKCGAAVKLAVLASEGFSKKLACSLVVNSPSVLLQSAQPELKHKLRMLLSVPGVTHLIIADSAKKYLHHSLAFIQARIEFAHQHKEDLLCCDHLDNLLTTTDEEFATLCDHNVQYFYSQTGFFPLSSYEKFARKRGRPRKRPLPSTSEEPCISIAKFTKAEKCDTLQDYSPVPAVATLDDIFDKQSQHTQLLHTRKSCSQEYRHHPDPPCNTQDTEPVDIIGSTSSVENISIFDDSEKANFNSLSPQATDFHPTITLPPADMLCYEPDLVSALPKPGVSDHERTCSNQESPTHVLDSKNVLVEGSQDVLISREMVELLQDLRATSFTRDSPSVDHSSVNRSWREMDAVNDDSLFWGDIDDDNWGPQTLQMPGSMR